MVGGGPYDRFVIKKQERQVAPPDEWDFELWRNVKKTIILGSGEDHRNVIQDFKFRIRIFVSFQLSFFVLVSEIKCYHFHTVLFSVITAPHLQSLPLPLITIYHLGTCSFLFNWIMIIFTQRWS